jgi:hypothetical protein
MGYEHWDLCSDVTYLGACPNGLQQVFDFVLAHIKIAWLAAVGLMVRPIDARGSLRFVGTKICSRSL